MGTEREEQREMMGRKKRRPRARFLQSQANFVGLRLAAANLRLLSVLIFYDYCYYYFYDFYDFYELSIGRETRWRGQTEGRSGERADHDNRRRPNSLGKQNRSVCRWCRCCCCCYSRAATGAAASANDDEMLPPSYDNNGKNNDTKGGTHNTPKTQAETETETETTLQTGNVWHTRFTLHTGAFCVVWCWFLYDFYQTKPIKHSIQSIYMWKSKRELLINPEAMRHATADASCAVGVNVSSARQQNSI